jgi:hypothetical protein
VERADPEPLPTRERTDNMPIIRQYLALSTSHFLIHFVKGNFLNVAFLNFVSANYYYGQEK